MSAAERAYAAADAWRALAEAAQDALAETDRTAGALIANNSSAAVDAFERAWRDLAAPGFDAPLPRLVRACHKLAQQCDEYAEGLSVTAF